MVMNNRRYTPEGISELKEHAHLTFLVTRISCGIAGFRDEEIAPLFTNTIEVENIILPREFVESCSMDGHTKASNRTQCEE